MSAREDAQGAVVGSAVVEVETDGQHLLEDLHGGLDVDDALFFRPGPPALDVDALLDGQAQVLVPGDFPVTVRGLVKEDGAGQFDTELLQSGIAENVLESGQEGIEAARAAATGGDFWKRAQPGFRGESLDELEAGGHAFRVRRAGVWPFQGSFTFGLPLTGRLHRQGLA